MNTRPDEIQALGFRVWGLGVKVGGLGSSSSCRPASAPPPASPESGFKGSGLRFGVWGLGSAMLG